MGCRGRSCVFPTKSLQPTPGAWADAGTGRVPGWTRLSRSGQENLRRTPVPKGNGSPWRAGMFASAFPSCGSRRPRMSRPASERAVV